jgi:hypothetical protein
MADSLFFLTDEERKAFKSYIVEKAKELGHNQYSEWTFEGDGYFESLQQALTEMRYLEWMDNIDRIGYAPCPDTKKALAEAEAEAFGRPLH